MELCLVFRKIQEVKNETDELLGTVRYRGLPKGTDSPPTTPERVISCHKENKGEQRESRVGVSGYLFPGDETRTLLQPECSNKLLGWPDHVQA